MQSRVIRRQKKYIIRHTALFSKKHLAFLISSNEHWSKHKHLLQNDILRCFYCIYCTFNLSVQFLWTDKIIRWSNLCRAHSWSFGGSVSKWRRNKNERFAEAVATGGTYISCKSFLTSEKMLQFEVNARVLQTSSFIFSLTPDTASLRRANWTENLEASRSSPKCFFTASMFTALTHACSRNQQLLEFCIRMKNFQVETLVHFTIDAVGNVEVYHTIILFRRTGCIGVGADKFLGVRRVFAQISANLPEKNPKKMTSKKCISLGGFSHVKALQASFLPKFYPSLPKFFLTCPKTTKFKYDLQKNTLILGASFVQSTHILQFCEGLHIFCPNVHTYCLNFNGFCQDFHQIKTFGGYCYTRCTPASDTSYWMYMTLSQIAGRSTCSRNTGSVSCNQSLREKFYQGYEDR